MPLYEYECTECHERTEKIQKFSDPEITVCPHCSGHLERVISAPAVAFKGGGWYADGYGNAKPKSSESKTQRLQDREHLFRHLKHARCLRTCCCSCAAASSDKK